MKASSGAGDAIHKNGGNAAVVAAERVKAIPRRRPVLLRWCCV